MLLVLLLGGSLIATNEMQSVNDHSLSGRAEKNSVPQEVSGKRVIRVTFGVDS